MINLLKNIPPVTVYVIGRIIDFVGKTLSGVATILYNVSATMHTLLETKTGKELKRIEKSVEDVMKLYASVANKVQTSNREENRLASIAKSAPNVTQLGKKNNEPKN